MKLGGHVGGVREEAGEETGFEAKSFIDTKYHLFTPPTCLLPATPTGDHSQGTNPQNKATKQITVYFINHY